MATRMSYERFVRGRGWGFRPPRQLVAALQEQGNNTLGFASRFRPILGPLTEQNLQEYLRACRDAGAIIYTLVGFLGYYVAGALGVLRVGVAVCSPVQSYQMVPKAARRVATNTGSDRLSQKPAQRF